MFSNSFIFIVNEETIKTHLKYGFCATGNPDEKIEYNDFLRPETQKICHGLMADILNVRSGDMIFFYTVRQGFTGIYKVTQTAFFDNKKIEEVPEGRPFRLLVEPLHCFDNPVPEHHLFLNPERQKIFWLWYFNKMRQRSRGCIPLDPDARDKLIELLIKQNGESVAIPQPDTYPERAKIQQIRSLKIPYDPQKEKILSEHSLRALMVFEFQTQSNTVSHVFGNFNQLEWFANEIPYNVAGKSIDILLYHKKRLEGLKICGRYQYTVIELKKDKAGVGELEQLQDYVTWVGDTLAEREHYLVQPVLLAYRFDDKIKELAKYIKTFHKPVRLIEYRYNETDGLKLQNVSY